MSVFSEFHAVTVFPLICICATLYVGSLTDVPTLNQNTTDHQNFKRQAKILRGNDPNYESRYAELSSSAWTMQDKVQGKWTAGTADMRLEWMDGIAKAPQLAFTFGWWKSAFSAPISPDGCLKLLAVIGRLANDVREFCAIPKWGRRYHRLGSICQAQGPKRCIASRGFILPVEGKGS